MHFYTPSTWKFVCMCGVGCLLILTSFFHYTWGVYPSLIWNSSYNHWLNTVYGQWTKSFYLLPFTILCSFLGPGFLLEHEQWNSFYKTGGTDSLIPPFTTDTFTMGVYLIACNDVVQLYFASKSLICSSNPHTLYSIKNNEYYTVLYQTISHIIENLIKIWHFAWVYTVSVHRYWTFSIR